MSAALERRFITLAQEALRSLLLHQGGDPLPRKALYREICHHGVGERQQSRVLLMLERAGVITSVRGDSPRSPFFWSIKDAARAKELVHSSEKLSPILWSREGNRPKIEAAPEEVFEADATPSDETAEAPSDLVSSPAQNFSPMPMLLLVLKSIKRMGDTMETISQQLTAMTQRLSALEQQGRPPVVPQSPSPPHPPAPVT